MNLWFRLLRILLISKWAKRIDLFDESRISFRVWLNDLDVNLHMNNGRYLTLMDLGRTYFMAGLEMLWKLPKKKWFPVVGAAEIKYYRALDPFRKFDLVTRLLTWDDKWFYIEQRFESGGKVCAIAVLRALFIGPAGKIATEEVIRLVRNEIPARPNHPILDFWAKET